MGAAWFWHNEDGLRVQKVTTSTGTTKYTLHSKNIVHMTGGSNTLHFFYDGQNKPAVVLFKELLTPTCTTCRAMSSRWLTQTAAR